MINKPYVMWCNPSQYIAGWLVFGKRRSSFDRGLEWDFRRNAISFIQDDI